MNKRREDVVYTSAAIMNKPKPKPKVTDSTPASGQQTPSNGEQQEKKDDVDMDGKDEGGPTIEEMDVD